MNSLSSCPCCGGDNLDEEATGCCEIYGVCHQTCWIECKNCGTCGPTVELNDGDGPSDYALVRDAWNIRNGHAETRCPFCGNDSLNNGECETCGAELYRKGHHHDPN